MVTINYKRRAKFRLYALSCLSIVLAIFLLWLNSLYNWQFDWTQGSRNTLSQSSIDLLKTMDTPLSLDAYFDSDSQTREQVRRFVGRYQRFKKDLVLNFIDTQLPSEEINKLGFTQLGQLKISYKDKQHVISRLSESIITDALFKLARKDDTWVVVVQGHGERDPLDAGSNGLSRITQELSKVGIKVQPLNLLSQGIIPNNTKVVVIAGARNAYLGSELELIDQFLEGGGNLLWLRDPSKQNYFKSLEHTLGIESVPGVVIDANTKLRILLGIKHAAVIPITEFHKHSITSALQTHALLPFANAFTSDDKSDWETQILFKSLERSWSETSDISKDELIFEQSSGDTQGPLTLGLALSKYQHGKQQRVVVVGDSDFIANGYLGYGANFTLGLNILNWLTEDESLMSISHQAASDQSLELNERDIMFIALVLLLFVPALLISIGFWLRWLRHRH